MPVDTEVKVTAVEPAKPARPVPMEKLSDAQHKKWLETGELPVQGAKEVKSLSDGKKNEPDAEKDAAEEVTEPGTETPREKKGVGSLTYKELRARVRELEAKLADASKDERREIKEEIEELVETAPKPKAEKASPRPKAGDQKEDGTPKFATWEEYEDALLEWNTERVLAKADERQTQREQEQTIAVQNRKIEQSWNTRVDKAREQHEDFDDVALAKDGPGKHIARGSVVDQWILDSKHGAEILYHFGNNLPDLLRYSKMNPIQASRELYKLEAGLADSSGASDFDDEPTPPKKDVKEIKVTKAPKPASEVGGRGTAAGDDVERALRDDPTKNEDAMRRFMAAENAKDIRERLGSRR